MPIAFMNDEINILDCQYSHVKGCIFDEKYSNQTMSCIIISYLKSRDYELVSEICLKVMFMYLFLIIKIKWREGGVLKPFYF